MATKKITLNELRSIVKQIIKEEMVLNEEANTDLELKSVAKQIFSVLKKYGLNPNYISGDIKLDKAYDSVVSIVKDTNTDTGLIKVNIWAWAVSKNKIDMKKLNSDIVQILGNEFENKSGQTSSGNDIIYSMIIRKKVAQQQQQQQQQQQPVSETLRLRNYFK